MNCASNWASIPTTSYLLLFWVGKFACNEPENGWSFFNDSQAHHVLIRVMCFFNNMMGFKNKM